MILSYNNLHISSGAITQIAFPNRTARLLAPHLCQPYRIARGTGGSSSNHFGCSHPQSKTCGTAPGCRASAQACSFRRFGQTFSWSAQPTSCWGWRHQVQGDV